ncbi:MAG TPA: hypothetical protein VFW95_00535 [Candidatus Limnocylindria bacterium]|nr:hypothetical protein [Candidatus Limnocylindria bacterium]
MTTERHLLQVLPDVCLELIADGRTSRQLLAEYADRYERRGAPDLVVRIGRGRSAADDPGRATSPGSHKTVSWSAHVSDPAAAPLELDLAIRGVPRWFAVSLTQGYLIEPLISVAAARTRTVLLPAAAVSLPGGAVLLVGRSRTGKSSVSARAAAAGIPVIGDDQVLVYPDGRLARFPRRMRFYDDLRVTAPDAFRRLGIRSRTALHARTLARYATGGYVRPSLAVDASELGQPGREAHLGRVIVLERTTNRSTTTYGGASVGETLEVLHGVLREQRRHLTALGPAWQSALEQVAAAEETVLTEALARVPIERLRIADHLSAPEAIDIVWNQLVRTSATPAAPSAGSSLTTPRG